LAAGEILARFQLWPADDIGSAPEGLINGEEVSEIHA
jgi:hypothetical protein